LLTLGANLPWTQQDFRVTGAGVQVGDHLAFPFLHPVLGC
jgi:hypothetical protein